MCAAAFSLIATSVVAGSYGDPIVVPEVIVADTVESAGSDDWVLALMIFLTIVVAGAGS